MHRGIIVSNNISMNFVEVIGKNISGRVDLYREKRTHEREFKKLVDRFSELVWGCVNRQAPATIEIAIDRLKETLGHEGIIFDDASIPAFKSLVSTLSSSKQGRLMFRPRSEAKGSLYVLWGKRESANIRGGNTACHFPVNVETTGEVRTLFVNGPVWLPTVRQFGDSVERPYFPKILRSKFPTGWRWGYSWSGFGEARHTSEPKRY